MDGKYKHKYAFRVMLFECLSCGFLTKTWNSRDGAIDNVSICPQCGMDTFTHTKEDIFDYCDPQYLPIKYNYVWIDFPESLKEVSVRMSSANPEELKKHLSGNPGFLIRIF